MTTRNFTTLTMQEIVTALSAALAPLAPGDTLSFLAVDPDIAVDRYSGESLTVAGRPCRYRDYQTWTDLAEVMGLALCTPKPAGPGLVRMRMRKLSHQGWHQAAAASGHREKYGSQTDYSRIRRCEEPTFLRSLEQSLRFLSPPPGGRVLSIGCNQGDELSLIDALLRAGQRAPSQLVGLDHSASAIAAGQARLTDPRYQLHCADLAAPLPVGRHDVIIAINVLHSPSLDGQAILSRLLREHRAAGGGLIIGLPSSRHRDHRVRFGAQARHASQPELSVLLKMANHYKRLLQRRGFHVTLTGKHTLLLTARAGQAAAMRSRTCERSSG